MLDVPIEGGDRLDQGLRIVFLERAHRLHDNRSTASTRVLYTHENDLCKILIQPLIFRVGTRDGQKPPPTRVNVFKWLRVPWRVGQNRSWFSYLPIIRRFVKSRSRRRGRAFMLYYPAPAATDAVSSDGRLEDSGNHPPGTPTAAACRAVRSSS